MSDCARLPPLPCTPLRYSRCFLQKIALTAGSGWWGRCWDNSWLAGGTWVTPSRTHGGHGGITIEGPHAWARCPWGCSMGRGPLHRPGAGGTCRQVSLMHQGCRYVGDSPPGCDGGLGRALGAPSKAWGEPWVPRAAEDGARVPGCGCKAGGAAECPAAGHPPSMVAASWGVSVVFFQLLAGLSPASLHPCTPPAPAGSPGGGQAGFLGSPGGWLALLPLAVGVACAQPRARGGSCGEGGDVERGKTRGEAAGMP